MAAPPPPPPPPSGIITKKIPLASEPYSPPTSPKPRQDGGNLGMGALMQELSTALGVPKEFINDDDDNYTPSPSNNAKMTRPGYTPPSALPKKGTQGFEKVFYTIKGPTAVKVQSFAIFELFCRNEEKQLVNLDGAILEAEMTELSNGDTSLGLVVKDRKGVFKIQFRGRNVGNYMISIYVKGQLEKKPIFSEGLPLEISPNDTSVSQNMYFTASGFGLHGGSVGRGYSFNIETKDDNGNPLEANVQKLFVEVLQGTKKSNATVHRLGPGKFRAEFVPYAPGEIIVSVIYGTQTVIETTVTYSAGVDPSKTFIIDPLRNALVGQQNTFNIQACSSTGEDINTGGEKFDVGCSGPGGGVTGLVVRDQVNGKYTVRFTFQKHGTYKFYITLKGAEIQGSPMEIEAR